MAYVFSTAQYSGTAAVTSLTLLLPDHATDDVIVFFASMDTGTATATGTTTGTWTDIGNTTSSNATGSCRYRKMTSSSEVFQLTTIDAYSITFVCCRDVDTTTALDATSNASNNNSTSPAPVNITVSAATANTLSLYSIGGAQIAAQIHSPPGFMSINSQDSTGTTASTSAHQGVCWYFNRVTGNVPVPTWFASITDVYTRYTVLLRNKSGGRIPAYVDDVASPAESLCMCHTNAARDYGGGNVTPTATLTNPNAQINSTTPTGVMALGADFGINPYSGALGNSAQTASTTYYGFEITYATARNASTGIICGSYVGSTPKVSNFGLGDQNKGGGVFRIASSTSAWALYQVVSKDSLPNPEGRYVFGIQAGYTGTVFGNQGTAVTTTAITATQSFANFPSFTGSLYLSELYIVKTLIVAGGDATYPVDNSGMVAIGKSFRLPVIQKQGGSGLFSFAKIQIGGGDAVNFQLTGGVLQFPKRYDANTLELSWHAADNAVGISYYGVSGSVIKHTNSSITSATPYYWEIHSSATNAATWDFTGLSIFNGTVTLRVAANAGYIRMSFTSCPTLTATSCSINSSTFSTNPNVAGTSAIFTNCTFTGNTTVTATSGTLTDCTLTSNPTVTADGTTISGTAFTTNTTVTTTTANISSSIFSGNATIALSGSTVSGSSFTSLPVGNSTISVDASTSFTSCSFNTSTLTAGNAPIVTTFAIFDGLFTSCTFTGSGSGGHAVQVTTTGTTTFAGNTFTSYGADGTTSAAFYNNSGGLITLNVTGGGTVPTYRNGAGASTVINANITVSVHVQDSNQNSLQDARVYAFRNSDSTVIINSLMTDASGDTSGDIGTGSGAITIRVRKSASGATRYIPIEASGTVASGNLSITVTLATDTIVATTTSGTISGNFAVDTAIKAIRNSGTTFYTVNDLYTWLMDYFDDAALMDDTIPMSAQTPTEYTLTNGWFIDEESIQYLRSGAIQTTSWTHPTNITGIRILTLNAASNLTIADIGKNVVGGTTGDTGKLLSYNTTTFKLWVRADAADDDFNNASEAITVDAAACGNMTIASVSGENIWSNIFTLGTLVAGTTVDLYRSDVQIIPWWSSGQIDILIKVKEADTEIDSGNITVLARLYSTLYDYFIIDASTGRNPVPLASFIDVNNENTEGTVGAYSGITFTFAYASKDLNNTNGSQPYDCVIECNNHPILEIYEYLKYVTRTGSATTLNGVNGEYYTGVGDIRFNYDIEAGGGTAFSQGELITGTSGGSPTGYLVSLFDAGTTGTMVLRNVHGTFTDNQVITGGTTGRTAQVNGTITSIDKSKQAPFGTFAGGQFFGARGVWLDNVASADANNYELIDSTGTTQTPPNTVATTITVQDLSTSLAIEGANVLVWVTNNANYFYQASVSITGSGTTATVTHTTHGLTTGDYVIIKGVTNDDDYNGVFQVNVTDGNQYTYTTTETLGASPATGASITSTFAIINGSTNSSGLIDDSRSLSVNQPVAGWARKSSGSPYYQQGTISGTIDSNSGLSTTIQLARDE